MRVFLDKIRIWSGGHSKLHCPPSCGWASSKTLRTWVTERKNVFLPAWLLELGHPSSPALDISGSQTFRLRQNYSTSYAGHPAYRCQIVGLLYNCMSHFFIISLCIYPTGAISLENSNLMTINCMNTYCHINTSVWSCLYHIASCKTSWLFQQKWHLYVPKFDNSYTKYNWSS